MSLTHPHRNPSRLATITSILATGSLLFTACGGKSQASDADPQTVSIGTGELSPVNDVISEVAREQGIDISWQSFSDWTLPNQALVNAETDINAFQHLAFLSAFNSAQGTDITPVGSTQVTTWGLYSQEHASVDSLPDGAKIAIPNDPSNGARTLFLLQAAGLIELADSVGIYPTVDDITRNPKNIIFNPIVAQQLVNVYPDVDGIVVGAATIDKALSITKDEALALDDPNAETSLPYVNVVAVRGQDKDSETYAKIADLWQDQRVKDAIAEETKGNSITVDIEVEKLRTTLAGLEELADDIKQ